MHADSLLIHPISLRNKWSRHSICSKIGFWSTLKMLDISLLINFEQFKVDQKRNSKSIWSLDWSKAVDQIQNGMHMRHVTTSSIFWTGSKSPYFGVLPLCSAKIPIQDHAPALIVQSNKSTEFELMYIYSAAYNIFKKINAMISRNPMSVANQNYANFKKYCPSPPPGVKYISYKYRKYVETYHLDFIFKVLVCS